MKSTGTAQRLQERRLRAMALLEQGHSQADVARLLGVTQGAVSHWKKAHGQGGQDALLARQHTGRPTKLSGKQGEKLVKLLKQGPCRHGWATALWTLPRVAALIERHFGVAYDQSGVWHVLRRLGWSCQKPVRRAREQNEAAVVQWRQRDWHRIKKRAS
jgi:transposase